MSHTSMILSALFLLAMTVFIAPGVFALNRGHVLRNLALWLAIFLGLSLFYQNFGPGSPHPLFNLPDSMQGMHREISLPQQQPSTQPTAATPDLPSRTPNAPPHLPGDDKSDSDKSSDDGSEGFSPPSD